MSAKVLFIPISFAQRSLLFIKATSFNEDFNYSIWWILILPQIDNIPVRIKLRRYKTCIVFCIKYFQINNPSYFEISYERNCFSSLNFVSNYTKNSNKESNLWNWNLWYFLELRSSDKFYSSKSLSLCPSQSPCTKRMHKSHTSNFTAQYLATYCKS